MSANPHYTTMVDETVEKLRSLVVTDMRGVLNDAASQLETMRNRCDWLERRHETEVFVAGYWIGRTTSGKGRAGIKIDLPDRRPDDLPQTGSYIYADSEDNREALLYHLCDAMLSAHEAAVAAAKLDPSK